MQGFKDMVPRKCRAVRDGSTRVLDAWELVPGDVVQVRAGRGCCQQRLQQLPS
jgi:sodium/potassium-transporting ATPase subunit alpha